MTTKAAFFSSVLVKGPALDAAAAEDKLQVIAVAVDLDEMRA